MANDLAETIARVRRDIAENVFRMSDLRALLDAAEAGAKVIAERERQKRYEANIENEAWFIRQKDRDA